ncbi:MAG TPA: SDR family oxidoreductase [Candidatus Limnocylindrales bacterium]|nr:SDR family oxidoreductase [Candidatus Limnocylindrales bacterium]
MNLAGKRVVITGAAGGIGAAMARRFHAEGASLVLSDLQAPEGLAAELDAIAVSCDVSDEAQVGKLVEVAGEIDLFCANAGIATGLGLDAGNDAWDRSWAVNVMAHVYSARAVLPGMLARGGGYLLHTCSAAGLLISLNDAPYNVTKHAAVAFAEWLTAMYGDKGIRVSALCPQGVRTPMLMEGLEKGELAARAVAAAGAILEPEEVAEFVVQGLAEERFLILPHPEVAMYQQRKVADPDRWLAGVRRLIR